MPKKKKIKPEEEIPETISKNLDELKSNGVKILSIYREPYKGNYQIFALMPIGMIKSAPFQRELSTQHVKKLSEAISRAGRYLDPIIVIKSRTGEYWTPNGHHRKEAALRLGMEELPVILLLEEEAGRYVLAMNVEKAHTVRDKSLEVIKLYEELMTIKPEEPEANFAGIFENGIYATFGLIYKTNEKFHGSAYENLLKKVDNFFEEPLTKAYKLRQVRAELIKDVDVIVEETVRNLKERGINHPFLWAAIVSSANPIKRKRLVEESFEEVIEKLKENLTKISAEDISRASLDEF